jgi:putative ABC transport system ATP-binding protein
MQYDAGMVHALKDISLEIAQGEVCSITGPSGCGKSTLLNMIGALDKPTSGEIMIKGCPLASFSPHQYRSRIAGFVFQLHNLLPHITLLENIELPLMARKTIDPHQRSEMAMQLLSEFGLAHRADFFPVDVSGGERQRTAVARALVNQPEILLADEPTGSVDSHTSTLIIDSILRRCEAHGMTAVIVTHNPEIAKRTARKISMYDGRLI